MQLAAGILADRRGGVRMLLFGGTISSVGVLLFAVAPTPGWLYVCRGLTAFGDSFIYLCAAKELTLLFPRERFARLSGILQFCGGLGGVLAMLPFERATHQFGWHVSLPRRAA
jgi:MFS family permease